MEEKKIPNTTTEDFLYGSYGKEPFDERLIFLRVLKQWKQMLLIVVAGILVGSGLYYGGSLLASGGDKYLTKTYFKVEYLAPIQELNAYYINPYTYDVYMKTADFVAQIRQELKAYAPVEKALGGKQVTEKLLAYDDATLTGFYSMDVEADYYVPCVRVVMADPMESKILCRAIEQVMVGYEADFIEEVSTIAVLDQGEPVLVDKDIRLKNAVILIAVLMVLFTVIVFVMKEIGADSIWIPATLRKRYGLKNLGTLESAEVVANLRHAFENKKQVALCVMDADMNPVELAQAVQERMGVIAVDETVASECGEGAKSTRNGAEKTSSENTRKGEEKNVTSENAGDGWRNETAPTFIPVPTPILCPEAAEVMRSLEGVLLVVPAGQHSGKPLEQLLEFFASQDISVTGALLCDADDKLIKAYYRIGGSK